MTSRFEGLPMVLLEAQSYGLPIVAFDCDTGPAEIVVEGTGFLVKPNEITDFSNRMLQLTSMSVEDYNNLCLNAKINNQHYSLKNIINKWVVGVA